MVKKIVYTKNGSVVFDSISRKYPEQHYIDIMISRGFSDAVIMESENFPDEEYHEAWELSGSTISVNMTTAKEIHRNILRRERDSHFQILDRLYLEAQSSKKGLEDIKTRQQYLRDITEDPAIDAATTTTELKAVTISPWTIPAIKLSNDDITLHINEDELESSTTSKSFKRKSRLTFNSVAAKYLISFTAEVKNTNKQGNCRISVLLDNDEINRTTRKADPFELDYNIVSGSIIKTLTEGEHNLDLTYATSKGVCFIRRVRLQAMKIET